MDYNTDNCAGVEAKQNELSQIKTAITELEGVKSEVVHLASEIVSRLCGAIPDCTPNSKDLLSGGGALNCIKTDIIGIKESLYIALDDLKRLNRETQE